MIGRLTGVLIDSDGDQIMMDVHGVGYIVHISESTRMALPKAGATISLYTDLLVREDLLQLFGFSSRLEKEWHQLLMSVQGVGAKASMAIIGALGAEAIGRAIAMEDWASIRAAKGIGPKMAQRIVMDLKDKAPHIMILSGTEKHTLVVQPDDEKQSSERVTLPTDHVEPQISATARADALSALSNLGYSTSEAASAVVQAAHANNNLEAPDLIREALKILAPVS